MIDILTKMFMGKITAYLEKELGLPSTYIEKAKEFLKKVKVKKYESVGRELYIDVEHETLGVFKVNFVPRDTKS